MGFNCCVSLLVFVPSVVVGLDFSLTVVTLVFWILFELVLITDVLW